MIEPLPLSADPAQRRAQYAAVRESLHALLEDQTDWIAAMATVICELHHAFEYYDWTGFYRVVNKDLLLIGPYQGTHGCIAIAFSRGVCGAAARSKSTQIVPDVNAFPDHIACSANTLSEIVVPVLNATGELLAVLDVDSNAPAAFTEVDARELEAICSELGRRFG